MYSDKESYLWYVKQMVSPRWFEKMPKEFVAAVRCYFALVQHMQYINNKYKK